MLNNVYEEKRVIITSCRKKWRLHCDDGQKVSYRL